MPKEKIDVFYIVFSSYAIGILRELEKGEPKRFRDFKKLAKSEQTLSTRLNQLVANKVIEFMPILTPKGYVNGYRLTEKGREILTKLNNLAK